MTTTKVVFAKLSLTETIKFHKPQKVHAKTKIKTYKSRNLLVLVFCIGFASSCNLYVHGHGER